MPHETAEKQVSDAPDSYNNVDNYYEKRGPKRLPFSLSSFQQ